MKLKNLLANKNVVTIIGAVLIVIVLYAFYKWRVNSAINPITVPYAKETIGPRTKITNDMIGHLEIQQSSLKGNVLTNENTQIVGMYIGEKVYALTNIQECVDYFGETEDVAVCKFEETVDSNIKSAFVNTEMIATPIKGVIEKIILVNENQQLFKDSVELYNVWLTRAIIFFVDGREVAFEKDIIPFSEEIIIRRGYDLIEKLSDEKEFLASWGEGVVPKCIREIEEII